MKKSEVPNGTDDKADNDCLPPNIGYDKKIGTFVYERKLVLSYQISIKEKGGQKSTCSVFIRQRCY